MKNVFLAATVMALLCTGSQETEAWQNFSAGNYQTPAHMHRHPVKSRVSGSSVQDMVRVEASRQGVPVSFALAVADHESKFRCSAVGKHGERGVMQIKPATARGIGYTGTARGLNDCKTGIYWGMKYLKMAITHAKGDLRRAAFYYNAGIGAKSREPHKKAYVLALFSKKGLTR